MKPTWRKTELALAYDVGTGKGRVLPMADHRDYSAKGPLEFVGTADVVFLRDGLLTVDDYKSGRPENVEVAETNTQMALLGLAAARAYGVDRVRVRLLFVSEDGVEVDEAIFDELDLSEMASRLSGLVAKLKGPSVPVPGAHCKWCPIQVACPATQAAMATVARASLPMFPMSVDIESKEHAAYLRHRLKAVREASDAVENALKAYIADKGPIPAGEGKLYGIKEVKRETLDLAAPKAYGVLVKHLGQEKADEACELSTTKSAIHAALAGGKRGEGAKKEAALFEELRAIGAVRTSTYQRLDEYTDTTHQLEQKAS